MYTYSWFGQSRIFEIALYRRSRIWEYTYKHINNRFVQNQADPAFPIKTNFQENEAKKEFFCFYKKNNRMEGKLNLVRKFQILISKVSWIHSKMYNFWQAQSQSNPISIDWTEIALSLLKTNHHLGSATDPPTQDSKRKRS